jgi:hypothetical protein
VDDQQNEQSEDIFKGHGVEIALNAKEDFLKIVETLTRIGVPSKSENSLTQTCHILHKRGRYCILMFKEMWALDGKPCTFNEDDKANRNRIVLLLQQWKLVRIVSEESLEPVADLSKIKIIPFAEKSKYVLVSKYAVGSKKKKKVIDPEL